MIIVGTAGRAGAGKDTVADHLVAHHGFKKFSFSDTVYTEVMEAFDVSESLLRNRETKDTPTFSLSLYRCKDTFFVGVALAQLEKKYPSIPTPELNHHALSPREVLQWWGTEYRRAQDPDYWIKKSQLWLDSVKQATGDLVGVVNTSVRFANECEFIRSNGGSLWHVMRRDLPPMANEGHVSEKPLPVRIGDFVIYNTDTVHYLGVAVDNALQELLERAK